jgi:tRNA(Arg) A34 adenosine deaminase TadA
MDRASLCSLCDQALLMCRTLQVVVGYRDEVHGEKEKADQGEKRVWTGSGVRVRGRSW